MEDTVDLLNTRLLEIDLTVNDVHLYDMEAYKIYLNLHRSQFIASKAKEVFLGTALARPIQIFGSALESTIRNELKNHIGSSPQFKRFVDPNSSTVMDDWANRELTPIVDELFDIYYSVGFAGLKLIKVPNSPLPNVRVLRPEDGRYFEVRNKLKMETLYGFQWNSMDFKLQANYENGSPLSVFDRKTPQYGLVGFNGKKIPYDPDVVWFMPFKPRPVKDNTMAFIALSEKYINGDQDGGVRSFSYARFQSSYTAPWCGILPKYLQYLRVSETVIRLEEEKVCKPLYVENEIKDSDLYEKMFPTDPRLGNSLAQKEVQELFSPSKKKNIPYDPRTRDLPKDSLPSLFEHSNSERMKRPDRKPTETEGVISGALALKNFKDRARQMFGESQMFSRGVLNEYLVVGGRRVAIGGPTQRFKWATSESGRSDWPLFVQEYFNVLCENYALPTTVFHKNKNAKVEMNTAEKEMIDKRVRYIANKISVFFKDEIIEPIARNDREVLAEKRRQKLRIAMLHQKRKKKEREKTLAGKETAIEKMRNKYFEGNELPGVFSYDLSNEGTLKLTPEEERDIEDDIRGYKEYLDIHIEFNIVMDFDTETLLMLAQSNLPDLINDRILYMLNERFGFFSDIDGWPISKDNSFETFKKSLDESREKEFQRNLEFQARTKGLGNGEKGKKDDEKKDDDGKKDDKDEEEDEDDEKKEEKKSNGSSKRKNEEKDSESKKKKK